MTGIQNQPGNQGSIRARLWQDLQLKWRSNPLLRIKAGLNSPDTLLIAPSSLGKGNAEKAREIYTGIFNFSGEKKLIEGGSPFTTPATSVEWASELHGFRWLRHLNAADTPLNRSNAQILVSDWIELLSRKQKGVAWQVEVLAERIISWLTWSPLIIEGADAGFYQAFIRSINDQLYVLNTNINSTPSSVARLKARIAICFASLCLGRQGTGRSKTNQSRAVKALSIELQQQFFADGGHISRNPDEALEALGYLLPLYQLFDQLAIEPPEQLLTTLDRALPMLEFFRHRDGNSGLFNGASNTGRDLMETVLRVGKRSGQPPDNAVHSGYQRLKAGTTTILVDTGKAVTPEFSCTAHAGCLSFEMSSGTNRYIVNCGTPGPGDKQYRQLARSTAAHSTAIINDTSSCRIKNQPRLEDHLKSPIIRGINVVNITRSGDKKGEWICASHDGYLDPFGFIHQRTIFLDIDGNTINGMDQFLQDDKNVPDCNVENQSTIRFHLHPFVEPQLQEDGISILLQTTDGDVWKFTCIDAALALEDSVFFSDPLQKTRQIVLTSNPLESSDIRWVFEKQPSNGSSKPQKSKASPRQKPEDLLDIFARESNEE